MNSLELKLTRARWSLIIAEPFIGPIAMSLPDVISETAAKTHTDGKRMYWNRAHLATLSVAKIEAEMFRAIMAAAKTLSRHKFIHSPSIAAGDFGINFLMSRTK